MSFVKIVNRQYEPKNLIDIINVTQITCIAESSKSGYYSVSLSDGSGILVSSEDAKRLFDIIGVSL